jgi:hypothetical protein
VLPEALAASISRFSRSEIDAMGLTLRPVGDRGVDVRNSRTEVLDPHLRPIGGRAGR